MRENPIGFRVQRLNHSAIMTLMLGRVEKAIFEIDLCLCVVRSDSFKNYILRCHSLSPSFHTYFNFV